MENNHHYPSYHCCSYAKSIFCLPSILNPFYTHPIIPTPISPRKQHKKFHIFHLFNEKFSNYSSNAFARRIQSLIIEIDNDVVETNVDVLHFRCSSILFFLHFNALLATLNSWFFAVWMLGDVIDVSCWDFFGIRTFLNWNFLKN